MSSMFCSFIGSVCSCLPTRKRVSLGKTSQGPNHGWYAALVFAIHPMRVESVAWASIRGDLVGASFFLLSLFGYLRANVRAKCSRQFDALGHSLGRRFFCFALGQPDRSGFTVHLVGARYLSLGPAVRRTNSTLGQRAISSMGKGSLFCPSERRFDDQFYRTPLRLGSSIIRPRWNSDLAVIFARRLRHFISWKSVLPIGLTPAMSSMHGLWPGISAPVRCSVSALPPWASDGPPWWRLGFVFYFLLCLSSGAISPHSKFCRTGSPI